MIHMRGGKGVLVKAIAHRLRELILVFSIHTPILLVVLEYILSDGRPYFGLVARRRRFVNGHIAGLL